jgi:hypothetical protein
MPSSDFVLANGYTIVALCCLAFFGDPLGGTADEPGVPNKIAGNAQFEPLFNGRDFSGWRRTANWRIADRAFYCHEVDERHSSDNNLHYDAGRLPGDCELVFEWREGAKSKDSKRLNPGLGINYNTGIPGGGSAFSYGAGIDYHVSGIDIRLHTRSIHDPSVVSHQFNSGFLSTWPAKDFSKRIGEWNQSRILCKGSRIQFWLNGKQAFDLDLERVRGKGGDDRPEYLAIDDWIRRGNNGLYLSIVAPFSNELAAPRVQIRSVAVRRLKEMEQHQPEARTILDLGEAPGPWRGGTPMPPPNVIPHQNEESGPTETRPR